MGLGENRQNAAFNGSDTLNIKLKDSFSVMGTGKINTPQGAGKCSITRSQIIGRHKYLEIDFT